MKVLGIETLFGEQLLRRLPINYRFMVKVEARTFGENYAGRRFSQSALHQSRAFLSTRPGKPVSSLILQEYLDGHGQR